MVGNLHIHWHVSQPYIFCRLSSTAKTQELFCYTPAIFDVREKITHVQSMSDIIILMNTGGIQPGNDISILTEQFKNFKGRQFKQIKKSTDKSLFPCSDWALLKSTHPWKRSFCEFSSLSGGFKAPKCSALTLYSSFTYNYTYVQHL